MIVHTEQLRAAVKAVAPAIGNNPQMPQLAAVNLLAFSNGETTGLFLRASDMLLWIESRVDMIEGDIDQAWECKVSHRLLNAIVGVASGKEISILADERSLLIECGRMQWRLPIMHKAGQSELVPIRPPLWLTVDAQEFIFAAGLIGMAAGKDPSIEPATDVIELAVLGNWLHLTATNGGARIHTTRILCQSELGDMSIYADAHYLVEIIDSYDELDGRLSLYAGPSGVMATDDGRTCTMLPTKAVTRWLDIDKRIAAWQGQVKARTTIGVRELLTATKAASITSAPLTKDLGARVQFVCTEGGVSLAGYDDDGQIGKSHIPLDDGTAQHEGPGLIASVSSRYLVPALTCIPGDSLVEIGWTKPVGALLIRVLDTEHTIFAVMSLAHNDSMWVSE